VFTSVSAAPPVAPYEPSKLSEKSTRLRLWGAGASENRRRVDSRDLFILGPRIKNWRQRRILRKLLPPPRDVVESVGGGCGDGGVTL